MEATRVAISEVTGAGLVLPPEPPGEAQPLHAAYARYLAQCCRQLLSAEPLLPSSVRPVYERVASCVRQALVRNRKQTLACFASPVIGASLLSLNLRDALSLFAPRIDEAATQMLPNLMLELGLRGLLPPELQTEFGGEIRPLLSFRLGGEITPPAGTNRLCFAKDSLIAMCDGGHSHRLPLAPEAMGRALGSSEGDFRFDRRYWPCGGVTRVATVDTNPIAGFEAHPDKEGNHIDLGGHSVEEWVRSLDESFSLVGEFLPGVFTEMGPLLHQMVPVGYDAEKHLSASLREAIGTVYLTLHPDVMTMTEAVIHEFQHNKLNVSGYSADYLVNAYHPLYKSPVRPDPRPLSGILLAVHAFLPVAEFYRRMRDAKHPLAENPEFTRRLTAIDGKNREGMAMLRENGEFTAQGQTLFAELEEVERRHAADRQARGDAPLSVSDSHSA